MLKLTEVSKTYSRDHTKIEALRDISLEVREGEFVALMGPSGSGKSTLLHLMGGLDRPTSGLVLFHDKNLGNMGDAELSRFRNSSVGFVFQDALLLPHLTVEENVALPGAFGNAERETRNAERETIFALLAEAGLANRAGHKPNELSGGEAQRACIARALARSPSLVLADEPTGNLDTETGRKILKLFQKLHETHQTTFVIATHDPEIAKCAQKIIQLKNGEIISA